MRYVKLKGVSEEIDNHMVDKGYKYKLVPLGKHEDLDPLYAKNESQVRSLRERPPVKGMKLSIEFL